MSYKTGRYTTGVTFIAIGVLVLLQQFTSTNVLETALKLWPLVIIGYGLEYLLAVRNPERTRFDFGGAFFIGFLIMIMAAYSYFGGFLFNFKEMKYSYQADPIHYASNEVGGLDVEGLFGTVTVEASPDQKITIIPTYRSSNSKSIEKMIEEVGLQTSLQSETLVIKGHKLLGRSVGFNFFGMNPSGVDLHIYAPSEVAVKISNSFGNIDVRGMKNIRSVEQNFGNINIYDSQGNLKVKSDFGSVHLRDYTGMLNVRSSFGEVNIDGEILGTWDIKNDFGTVELSLPKESSYQYRFKVDFGNRDVPNPPFTNNESGSINGGEHQLLVDVSFGSIEVDLK